MGDKKIEDLINYLQNIKEKYGNLDLVGNMDIPIDDFEDAIEVCPEENLVRMFML